MPVCERPVRSPERSGPAWKAGHARPAKGVRDDASPACHSLPAAKARTPAPPSIAQQRPRANALRWFVTCRTCLEAAPHSDSLRHRPKVQRTAPPLKYATAPVTLLSTACHPHAIVTIRISSSERYVFHRQVTFRVICSIPSSCHPSPNTPQACSVRPWPPSRVISCT
jgi:hypothetical protein